MDKTKKGKKNRQGNNMEVDDQGEKATVVPTTTSNQVKTNQKKKSVRVNLPVKNSDDEDSDGNEVPVMRKGNQKMSAFQMLAMDDSSDKEQSESDSDSSVETKRVEVVNQKKGKKGKHDKKNAKQEKDEDIDKIVAEISNATSGNKTQKKKGEKKKDLTEEEEKPEIAKVDSTSVAEDKPINITSNMTQEELYKVMDQMALDDEDDDDNDKRKSKKKSAKKQGRKEESDEEKEDEKEEETSTMKSAAEKRKDKKARQKADKQKKTETKGKTVTQEENAELTKDKQDEETGKATESKGKTGGKPEDKEKETAISKMEQVNEEAKVAVEAKGDEGEEPEKTSKKDKKKKNPDKVKDKETTKKPSKMVQEILERQKRLKEEEERLKREEEERIRKEEEAIRLKEEEERRIREKKERDKQRKKEKIERQKQEGTYLTEKQKADKRRLLQMVETYQKELGEDGMLRAATTERKGPKYEKKTKKNRQAVPDVKDGLPDEVQTIKIESAATESTVATESQEKQEPPVKEVEQKEEEVKDSWDMSSTDEEDEEEEEKTKQGTEVITAKEVSVNKEPSKETKKKEEPMSEEEDSSSEEEDSDSEDSSEEDDGKSAHQRARDKAIARIKKRTEEAEANKSLNLLRAPVVCVLGHVDTGKTKILDKLRRTNVQDGEAGGITQQIGATNVPQETIREQTKMCKEFQKQELKVPGLLIIDTPGHESFSNLRVRGSSLCDIAILVVDIMHGLEPQTVESINLLKQKKTPFVVALNKIDRLYGWQTNPHSDVINTLNRQKDNTRVEFKDRTKEVIGQFANQGLNAILFNENKNPREYISLVPTSAHTGDGMGNLIALLCDLLQNMLAKRLMFSEELKATVMEVKTIPGHGTTIDVILVNGRIREGQTIVIAGQEGPIVTQIRTLMMPQPLRELRVKSNYEHHKEIVAAQGCKVVAKDLEKALAGFPLLVAHDTDEAEIYREELSQMLKDVLNDINISDKGVYVQASTLGSLEALLEFLKKSEVPVAGINIGPVHKRDVTKASVMLEHDTLYATILAFDVKVEHEAQVLADSLGVRIFIAEIIYHLFDAFTKYKDEAKKRLQEELRPIAVFPCKLQIMPQYVFNARDPIVVGVIVEAGFIRDGTLLCVPNKEFLEIGRVTSIEVNHKTVDRATKGQEVCIKIEPIPGDSPKMVGRHFEVTDLLVSKISRQSIDAVKKAFREDMSKSDWALLIELKKTFEIL